MSRTIEFDTIELLHILTKCRAFISTKKLVSWVSHFVFRYNIVYASDFQNSILYHTAYDFGEQGFAIPAKELHDLVKLVDSEKCKFVIDDKNNVLFTSNGSAIKFKAFNMDKIRYAEVNEDFTEMPEDMFEVIKKTMFSMCDDATKPQFCGVEVSNGAVFSSDTHRMTKILADTAIDFFIPSQLLTVIADFEEQIRAVSVGKSDICIKYDDFIVCGRRLVVEFPVDLAEGAIASHAEIVGVTFSVDKDKLAKILQRAIIFADVESRKITITITKDSIHVYNENEKARLDETLDATITNLEGEKDEFDIDAKKLLDALSIASEFKRANKFLYLINDKAEHLVGTITRAGGQNEGKAD